MRIKPRKPFKRLYFEQLESRSMLAASGLGVLAGAGGGFPVGSGPGDVPALIGSVMPGAALTSFDGQVANSLAVQNATSVSAGISVGFTSGNASNPFGATGRPATQFDAGSGNGQITLTTGAGTPGISSFAMPTNGFSDKFGGTS